MLVRSLVYVGEIVRSWGWYSSLTQRRWDAAASISSRMIVNCSSGHSIVPFHMHFLH
jgi:hypothetical protein